MPVLKLSNPKVLQQKKTGLNEDIIVAAGKVLLHRVSRPERDTFDELRLHQYFHSRKEVSLDAITS